MANWLDNFNDGEETPVNYNSIPTGIIKPPKIVYTTSGSRYMPEEQTIYLNPEDNYYDPSIYQHEMFHHWQNLNDKLRKPDEYEGPLVKPSIVANEEAQMDYYNRRNVETKQEFDKLYKQFPVFRLTSPYLNYDKKVNPELYKNPKYAEGEAEEYQNYIKGGGTPAFMAKGGLIKRADGSYSRRGLWDNIRANRGSGRKPTAEMLRQERKIKKKEDGGWIDMYAEGDVVGEDPKPVTPTSTPISYNTNDFFITPDEVKLYEQRAKDCHEGNAGCLEQAFNYYDKYVAPNLGTPNSWNIKQNAGVSSGNNNPRFKDYESSADSWDIHGLLQEKGATKILAADINNPNNIEQELSKMSLDQQKDYFRNLHIPVGSIVGMGSKSGTVAGYGNISYNNKLGLPASRHSGEIIGYDETGLPMMYDYGQIVPITNRTFNSTDYPITNITAPKETAQYTYEYLKANNKLQNDYTPLNLKTNTTEYDEDEYIPFIDALKNNKAKYANAFGLTNTEYDEFAKKAAALALTETKGGDDNTWRGIIPTYITDKLGLGDTTGITQINSDMIFNSKELSKKLEAVGITKDNYDPWNSDHIAAATIALLKSNVRPAERAYNINTQKLGYDPGLSDAAITYYQWNQPSLLIKGEAKGESEKVKKFQNNYNLIDIGDYLQLNPEGIPSTTLSGVEIVGKKADGGWIDMYNAGSWVEDSSLPQPTTPSFYEAYPDRTLTNYQMGTDKALMYGPGGGVDPKILETYNWEKQYINSPRFKYLSQKQGDTPEMTNQRINVVNNFDFSRDLVKAPKRETPHIGDGKDGRVKYFTNENQGDWDNIMDIHAHEFGHLPYNDGNLTFPDTLKQEMQNRNIEYQKFLKTGKTDENIEHDIHPNEIRADKDWMLFQLQKAGIYDATKDGDIKQEHLDKFKEMNLWNRLNRLYKDEDIIWLINNVAQNNSNTPSMQVAKFGGPVMYNAGSTVWTKQNVSTVVGSNTPSSVTQNYRNTGSLNPNRYLIGDVIPTGMDYKTPAAGTYDYNKDIQPAEKMIVHAPDTLRIGKVKKAEHGSHVTSAYKKRVGIPYAISPGVSDAGMHVGPTTQRGITFANGGWINKYEDAGFIGGNDEYEKAKAQYIKASNMGPMGENQMQQLVKQFPLLANDSSLASYRSVGNAAMYRNKEEANRVETNTLGQVISTPASRLKAQREEIVKRRPEVYNVQDYKMGIQEPGAPNDVTNDPIAMALLGTAIGGVGLGTRGAKALVTDFAGNLASEATMGAADLTKGGFKIGENLFKNIKTPKVIQNFSDAYKSTKSLMGEVKGELLHGFENRKAIQEGNEWFANWVTHPKSQAKIEDSINKAIDLRNQYYHQDVTKHVEDLNNGVINQIQFNNLIDDINLDYNHEVGKLNLFKDQAKNYKNYSKEYPLKKQFEENFLQYFGKGDRNIHLDNAGISNVHYKKPYGTLLDMSTSLRNSGNWISRKSPNFLKKIGTTIHENTHGWATNFGLGASGQKNFILSLMPKEVKANYLEWKNLGGGEKALKELGEKNAFKGYIANPTEMHARTMELRKAFDLTPDDIIDETMAADMMETMRSNRHIINGQEEYLDTFGRDPKKMASLFNNLWVAAPAAIGAGMYNAPSTQTEQKQANGGYVKNNNSNTWLDQYN